MGKKLYTHICAFACISSVNIKFKNFIRTSFTNLRAFIFIYAQRGARKPSQTLKAENSVLCNMIKGPYSREISMHKNKNCLRTRGAKRQKPTKEGGHGSKERG